MTNHIAEKTEFKIKVKHILIELPLYQALSIILGIVREMC